MKHKLTMPQCKQLWYSFYAYILFPISVDYALLVCLNWSPQPTKPANTHEMIDELSEKNEIMPSQGTHSNISLIIIDIGLEDNAQTCIKYSNNTQCNGIKTCKNYSLHYK